MESKRFRKAAIFSLIFFLAVLACINSFIQDDAFISFRYASNLVYDHELTWNPGDTEKIEGYTNFLWTLILAIPIALNYDPVFSSKLIGLLFFMGTLIFTYKLSFLVFRSFSLALLTIFILGTNFTFSAYATGGLETQMQTFFIVAAAYLTLLIANYNRWKSIHLIVLSLLFSAALLTRLDSAAILLILCIYLIYNMFKQTQALKYLILNIGCFVFPISAILVSWLLWKYSYYGDVLPNAFYAKASLTSAGILKSGLFYIIAFLRSYVLIPFIVLGALYFKKIWTHIHMRLFTFILILWCLYIIKVGGDFMEFRFFVPVLPFIYILIVYLVSMVSKLNIRMVFIATVLIGSLFHALSFNSVRGIESIKGLNSHLVIPSENWIKVGLIFKDMFFESEDPIIIATTAAGAIPYYSGLQTIDMIGINDKWIAKNGIITSVRPGHLRISTLEYLVRRRVNIVIGHPHVMPISKSSSFSLYDLERFSIKDVNAALIPETARILEIPLDAKYKILVLYLCRNNYIDSVIDKMKLRTISISRG